MQIIRGGKLYFLEEKFKDFSNIHYVNTSFISDYIIIYKQYSF